MVFFMVLPTKLRITGVNLDLTLTEAISNNHVRLVIEKDTNNFSRNTSSSVKNIPHSLKNKSGFEIRWKIVKTVN